MTTTKIPRKLKKALKKKLLLNWAKGWRMRDLKIVTVRMNDPRRTNPFYEKYTVGNCTVGEHELRRN